jgi:hypothetical protein
MSVKLAPTGHAGSDTRAPFGSFVTPDSPLRAYVLGSTTQGNYTSPYLCDWVEWTSEAGTGFENGNTSYYYPGGDATLYLVGLYPYTSSTTGAGWAQATAGTPTVTGGNQFVGTLDGKTDLMVADEVHRTATEANSSPMALQFRHIGTLLNVALLATRASAADSWGAVTGITLTGAGNGGTTMYTQATVTMGDASTTTISWGGPMTPLTFDTVLSSEEPLSLSLCTSAVGVGNVIAPAIVPSGHVDYVIRVTTTLKPEGVEVPVTLPINEDGSSTEGMGYNVTINFDPLGISIPKGNISVADWKVVGGIYPIQHLPSGTWAASNIYWAANADDSGKGYLTFDIPYDTDDGRDHRMNQGVFFAWNSLVGIAPVEGTLGTSSESLYLPATDDYSRAYRKSTAAQESDTEKYIGDICNYLTRGEWRMPTMADLDPLNEGSMKHWDADSDWGKDPLEHNTEEEREAGELEMPHTCVRLVVTVSGAAKWMVKLPAAGGYLADGESDPALYIQPGGEGAGYYWLSNPSTIDDKKAFILTFDKENISTMEQDKQTLAPIRCIKK